MKDAYLDDETHVDVDMIEGNSLLRSGWVSRYHQTPELAGLQNNAEHQWRVVALLYRYCKVLTPTLVYEALFHDAGEIIAGDVSGVSKARFPQIGYALKPIEASARERMGVKTRNLTVVQAGWLQWADIAECVSFMRMKRPDLESREDWSRTVKLAFNRGKALGLSDADAKEAMS